MSCALTLVVALPAEAKPLVSYYQLKKCYESTVFPLYTSADGRLKLIVTGIGKVRMAAAIAYLQQLQPSVAWLNIGIAGSSSFDIGACIQATKIVDQATQRAYYPTGRLSAELEQATVLSFDQPQTQYPDDAVIDMEASAFFQAATLFVDQELVHCVKVISDQNETQMRAITPMSAENLLIEALPILDAFIQIQLQDAVAELPTKDEQVFNFLKRWHFTQYQSNELKQLLRRWRVVSPTDDPYVFCQSQTNSKAVLSAMAEQLASLECRW